MPQIDSASFFSIIFWSFTLYTFGFLLLNLSLLFQLVSTIKLSLKYISALCVVAVSARRAVDGLTFAPLTSI